MSILKNKMAIILVTILVILIVIGIIIFNGNEKSKKEVTNQKNTSAIDVNDSAYEGMKIYEEDGDIIIEGEDGAKTIETTKTKKDSGLKETNEEEKQKYEISNVDVKPTGIGTSITGKIKNKDNKNHTVIINIKFYSKENKIKGANSIKLELEQEETKDFSMNIMEDVSQYKYKITVEYSK